MKIHFERKNFLRQFKLAVGATQSKDVRPILQNVKIVADENGAILMATDTEHGIRIRVDVDVEKTGVAIVPTKRFSKTLETANDDWLTLSYVQKNSQHIVMLDGQTGEESGEHTEFLTLDPDEYPNVADFTAESFHDVPVSDMQRLIKRTVFAADNENVKYALGGVCFEVEGEKILAIATNGRQLALQTTDVYNVNVPAVESTDTACVDDDDSDSVDSDDADSEFADSDDNEYDDDEETDDNETECDESEAESDDVDSAQATENKPNGFIVPKRTLLLLDKIIKDKSVQHNDVSVAFTQKTAMFRCKNVTVFSRLLKGCFPRWRGIIPSADTPMMHAEVKCKDMLDAVKNVQIVTSDYEPGVTLTFTSGKLTVEGVGKELGKMQRTIPIHFKGTATMKINPKYLLDMCKALDPNAPMTISMNGHDPVVIKTDNQKYTYLVMPISDGDYPVLDENGVDLHEICFQSQKQRLEEETAAIRATPSLSDNEKNQQTEDVRWEIERLEQDRKKRNEPKETALPPPEDDYQEEDDDETEDEDNPEIPIDDDGCITENYIESFDCGFPLALSNPLDGAQQEFYMELPRYCPAESLFRAKGKAYDDQPVVVEWRCIPGKRKLAKTKLDDYHREIVPDWSQPDRIVSADVFTCEMFHLGGMFSEKPESENDDPAPTERSPLQDNLTITAIGFDDKAEAEMKLRTALNKQAVERGYVIDDEEYEDEDDASEMNETDDETEDKRIDIESDIHDHHREIERLLRQIQSCQAVVNNSIALIQRAQDNIKRFTAELLALETRQPDSSPNPADTPAAQAHVEKITQWANEPSPIPTSAKSTPVSTSVRAMQHASPILNQRGMRFTK